MKFQRKKVATALAYALGVSGTVLLGSNALAQSPIKVEVTGSNIPRVEGETALPVTTITRTEIDKTGATTAMELLQLVSSNNSLGAVNIANSVGATTLSAQTASLRGLGGGRTLVLLNGQRMDNFAGEIQGVQGVNLAAIPFSAIDRVEILKDGASAIYGSDAIGGVINFITRTDYRGAEVSAQYGAPTRSGGGEAWQASGSFGMGDLSKDRYNVFFSLSYQEQKPLDQRDRNFSNSSFIEEIGLFGLSSNTFPARVTTGGIGVLNNGVPAGTTGCGTSRYVNAPDLGVVGCYFDPARTPGVQMIPSDKLWNAFAHGTFQLSPGWQAYVTGLYSHDETRLRIQPGPISNLFTYGPDEVPATVRIQPGSPFYPTAAATAAGVNGQPLNVRYRTFENGLRDTTDTNENGEVIVGLKGAWKNWNWDASGFYAEGKTTQALNGGFQDYRLLLPLLNSGVVNVFGYNTPAVVDQLRATNFVGTVIDGTSKNYGGRLKTSGEIWSLPAGAMALAMGVEARKEELEQNMAEPLQTGNLTGYGGQIKNVTGSRDQWAAFGELNIPVIRNLEANAAVRYDHYSDFGNTTNPKFSLRWQPAKQLLVRTSYGTGFLAPSLYQLYTPNISGVSQPGLSDPVRCPVTNDTGFDCATQFAVRFGGNANLKPELSEQFSAGFVFEPVVGTSFAVDYFKIRLKDAITNGISPLTILGDIGQFGYLVTRGAPDPAFPNLPGRIIRIDQTYVNLGGIHIEGLDLEAHHRTPAAAWGRLLFDVRGTYYMRYDTQNTDGTWSGTIGTALNSVVTGVIPRYKQYASVTLERGPWGLTVANNFQTSYTDQQTDFDGNERRVSTLSLWDLQAVYNGFKNTKLSLGVKNVFDTNPPKSNQQSTFIGGFDPSYYDPRARFIYGSVTYSWK